MCITVKGCCENGFWAGMAMGLITGAGLVWMLHPRCRKPKTGAGRAMEQVSDRVDKAAYRIRCVMKD